ncbi:hemerythrin domain-containing protein [Micromonospora sp. WMMD964]|uniref:hemerythrin domain-containing protein n=1 Tax=Micromonospora sp. WMMD964 TaxID=3016091 RepID=UPI00249A2F48|nr:hemerythrin domain-containing protein [Micromonospora sp. WMMD964]WFF00270.1 hemerythrin domain-containing protein [Micromonospora sp. WMMD964]
MSRNQNEPMADVRDMYMAHALMRRELGLLPRVVRGVTPGDAARAEIVGAHTELVTMILHLHHQGEDALLWPLLNARGGAEATAIVPIMEKQHHAIEEANETVAALLPGWRATGRGGDDLADACERLYTAVAEHMTLEEREILPLAEKHVTHAEWKQMGEHGMKDAPKKSVPLALGMMMYEADPEVIKGILAEAPLLIRLLMPIIAPRTYAKHAKRIHGTATPPRSTAIPA